MRLWKKKVAEAAASTTITDTMPATRLHTVIDNSGYSCKAFTISETGPTRSGNEDSIITVNPTGDAQTLFAMVADGMGGHNAGEVASSMACEVAGNFIRKQYQLADSRSMLEILVQQMHRGIRDAAAADNRLSGMGTTAVMLFIKEQQLHFAHVGDSRLYQYRNKELVQLTHDHTLVNQMVAEGKITAAEAQHHDMKNVLLQALGTVAQVTPELSEAVSIQQGDRFFLCSDGIYDALTPADIGQLLAIQQPQLIMECINALCYQRHARDNFSAILVEVTAPDQVSDNPPTREQNIFV